MYYKNFKKIVLFLIISYCAFAAEEISQDNNPLAIGPSDIPILQQEQEEIPPQPAQPDDLAAAASEEDAKAEEPIIVKSNQIKGPFFEFQKLEKDKKFIVVSEISNVLAFSKKKKGADPTTYHLVVVKAYPYLNAKCLEATDGERTYPIYCAFISEVYKNDWQLFTHFDPILGNIYSIPFQNLSLILQFIHAEMNLLMPSLEVKEGESSKIYDISCVYPTKWKDMIRALLSPQKGNNSSIYAFDYNAQNVGVFSNLSITRHKVFDDLEDGIIDPYVDIYRSLAALQPFWIPEEIFSDLDQSAEIFPFQYAEFPLVFSKKMDVLPATVDEGYVLAKKQKQSYPLTIRKLAEIIEANIKKEIEKIDDKKEQTTKRISMSSYMDEDDFRDLFQSHQHFKVSKTPHLIKFSKIAEFSRMIQQKTHILHDDNETYTQEKQDLLAYFQKIPESERDERLQLIFHKFLKRLDTVSDLKTKEEVVFKFKDLPFEDYLTASNDQKMVDLFQKQIRLLTEDVSRLKVIQYHTFLDQIEYMLEWLYIFYKFQKCAVILGKNFENYFEESEKELNNMELKSASLQFEEKLLLATQYQAREFILKTYEDYQDIILALRSIYPNIGYLPKQFELTSEEKQPPKRKKKDKTAKQITQHLETTIEPKAEQAPPPPAEAARPEKTAEQEIQRLKALKTAGKRVSLRDIQSVAKLRPKVDPTKIPPPPR
ncbi:MAG: hypothetical protein KBD31_05990 [Proteobacteria bacterium]|nr:hypothetical protein [Pseudomonadota bacterium]